MQIASIEYSLFNADDLCTVKSNVNYKENKSEQANKAGELRRGHAHGRIVDASFQSKKHTQMRTFHREL